MKCDEAKPSCDRCTSTGRQCDGYAPQITAKAAAAAVAAAASVSRISVMGNASGLSIHRPKHVLLCGSSGEGEGRAIQYFREAAGPYLSGATDPSFWTQLVLQFAGFEPAVKHSIVAISSLYEQVRQQTGSSPDTVRVWDNGMALKHYNAGIRELKALTADGADSDDRQPLVLLVCILFICIEVLQSNRDAAIAHCKHGIAILQRTAPNYPWTKEFLLPIFRRLSLFPFFFGNTPSDFPELVGPPPDGPAPETFLTFSDAQQKMDDIFSRTLSLVRKGDAYRFGSFRGLSPTAELLADQENLNHALDQWQVRFANFTGDPSLPDTPATQHFQLGTDYLSTMSRCFLLTRYEVCRIYANLALEPDEMGYDAYLEDFGRVFTHLLLLNETVPPQSKSPELMIGFIFEMGFMPMLFMVATKCRHLQMRLEALRSMRILGLPRENLWELDTVFALGRRIIEMEHDVQVDGAGHLVVSPDSPASGTDVPPPDHKRIRHSWTDQELSTRSVRGKQVRGRKIGFIMQGEKGNVYVHTEFLVEKETA